MKISTVNVVETLFDDVSSIESYTGDEEGKEEAEISFCDKIRKITPNENFNEEDFRVFCDSGYYVLDGKGLFLIRS